MNKFLSPLLIASLILFLAFDLSAQESPTKSKPSSTEIDDFLGRLSDEDFRVREAAELELWKFGRSIEPALIEYEKTADFEAQTRIKRIREKLKMGLTPDVPEKIRNLVVSLYRESDVQKQTAAIDQLVRDGHIVVVARYLADRKQLSDSMIYRISQSIGRVPPDAEVSATLDDLHVRLFELGLQNPKFGSAVVMRVMSSKYFRKRTDDAWLERILKAIAKCPKEQRYNLLRTLHFNQELSAKIASPDYVGKWIDLVATEPEYHKRRQLFERYCSPNRFDKEASFKIHQTPLDITETLRAVSDLGKVALLEAVLGIPSAISKLHSDLGEEALLKICESNEKMKHTIMGRLTALPFWGTGKDKGTDLVSLVDRETDSAVKQKLMGGFFYALASSRTKPTDLQVDKAWNRLTTGKPEAWQLGALLSTYARTSLAPKHNQETLDRVLELARSAEFSDLTTFVTRLRSKGTLLHQIEKNKLHGEVLRILRDHPKVSQHASLFSSLVGSSYFTNSLGSKSGRQSLIDFCLAKESDDVRYYLATGIISNHALLTQLLSDGQFKTMMDSLIASRDGSAGDRNYAELLGRFLSAKPVADHLVRSNNVELILSLKDLSLPSGLIDQVIAKIAASDSAVSAIFDTGNWEDVEELIGKIEDDAKRQTAKQSLFTRKAFAENLASHKLVVPTLKRLSQDKNWVSRQMFVPLIKKLPPSVAETEPAVALKFLEFADKLNGSGRNACLESLVESSWFADRIVAENAWPKVIDAFKKEDNGQRIPYLLKRRASDRETISQIKEGGLNGLVLMSNLLKSDEEKADYFQTIASSHYFGEWMRSDNQPESLIESLESIKDPELRRRFTFACFWQRALHDISDADRVAEKLVAYASRQPDSSGTLLAIALLSRSDILGDRIRKQDLSKCLQGDIAECIAIGMTDAAWRRDRNHWRNLIASLRVGDANRQPDLANKLWQLIINQKRVSQSTLAQQLTKTAWFIPQLRKQNKAGDFIKYIQANFSDWDRRGCTTQYAQSPAIIQELDSGSLLFFVDLCDTLSPKEMDHVVRYMGAYENVKAWFATSKQPDTILAALDSIKDKSRRERFAKAFLASGILGMQPENKELLPRVIAYSRKHSEEFQISLATSLLASYHTDDMAAKTDLPEFLISRLDRVKSNPELLARVLSSASIQDLIQARKLQRKAIDLVFTVEAPAPRLKCFRAVLQSTTLRDQLNDDEINKIFSLTQQQGQKELESLLIDRPYLVQRLTELGKYEAVRRFAHFSDPKTSSNNQWMLQINSAVVQQEREKGRKPSQLIRFLQDRDPRVVESRLRELGRRPEAISWILESYGWEPFGAALQSLPQRNRLMTISQLFQKSNVFVELAKLDRFEKLIEQGDLREFIVKQGGYVFLLRSNELRTLLPPKLLMTLIHDGYEQSDQIHRRLATRMFRNPWICDVAIESGYGEWMLDVLLRNPSGDSPKQRRQDRFKDLTSSHGLLRMAIRAGAFATAEELLSEFVDDDRGRLRLIRFQIHRELMEKANGNELVLSDNFKSLLQKDQRLAAYWARSQGDYDKAISVAKELADPGLVWSLTLESHDWGRLRELPACQWSQIPFKPANLKMNPIHRRIEQLGFLTALDQIENDANRSTSQLKSWVKQKANTPNTPRYGADALVSVNEIDEARNLLNRMLPLRAFYWHRFNLDFGKALENLSWDKTTPKAFFDRHSGRAIGIEKKRFSMANYLIQIAILLRDAGRDKEVDQIMKALHAHADHPQLTPKARSEYLRDLAATLHQRGFAGQGRKAIAMTSDESATHAYFLKAFADNQISGAEREASIWMNEFATRYPKETRSQHLQRVDDAMNARTPLKELRPLPDYEEGVVGSGVPVTRYRYKLYDQAIGIIQQKPRKLRSDYQLLGEVYLAQKKYANAATAFYEAYLHHPLDLTRLYLAGHCWQLAGDKAKATKLKLTARMLTVSFELNHGLAIGVANVGENQEALRADALQMYQTVMRSAPPGSHAYIQSLRQLAMHETDAKQAVNLWQEFTLYHMRPLQFYFELDVWLQSEFNLRAARATLAVEQDRIDDARKHWQQAIKIHPADVESTTKFATLLRSKDQNEYAKEIKTAQQTYLSAMQKQFPDSPVLKSRLEDLKN